MACDVLLIDAFHPGRVERGLIMPSWVIGQMSGFLEKEQIPFEVLFTIPQDDGDIAIFKDNKFVAGKFSETIQRLSPKIVFFYVEPELIHLIFKVHHETKKHLPQTLFSIGSLIGNAKPNDYLELGFDYLCGQNLFASFISLVKKIKTDQLPEKGRYCIDDNKTDLDHYPFFSRKFFNDAQPQWSFSSGRIEPFGIITGSLGCSSGCIHCPNSAFWGTTWRAMSGKRIADEIEYQKQLLNVNSFIFGDINFFPNFYSTAGGIKPHPEAIERFRCLDKLLEEGGLDVKLITCIRPDTVSFLANNSPDLLDRYLNRASICFLGIESFNEAILSKINKGITKPMISTVAKILDDGGVSIIASFMLGSPWETKETLAETEDFIMNELPSSSVPLFTIVTPYPGTTFYDDMEKKGLLLKKDITQYNGGNLVYKHPVFKEGELENKVQELYFDYFTKRFSG